MPTPTDLVTDLPADFEVFGQAVDTTLADLKGGTSGQILSKASNTDMDFTWITNDVGDITAITVSSPLTGGGTSGSVSVGILNGTTSNLGAVQLSDSTSSTSTTLAATANAVKTSYDLAAAAVPKSTVTTAGDVIYATGSGAVTRLGVGSTGQVLTVAAGVPSWATPSSGSNAFYAGKNKIINGDFYINQRNFTSTTTSGTYGFDRFNYYGVGGTVTYSAQTFTPGTAPVSGYEGANFARVLTSGQSGTGDYAALAQLIENVRNFAGQTATISFWAKAATGTPKISGEIVQSFGAGGSPSAGVNTYAGQVTLSTSWARYSMTVAVPSISGKTIGTTANTSALGLNLWVSAGSTLNARTNSLGIQNNTFDFWGVQVEAGSTATDFQTATGSIGGELALCQRYYQVITAGLATATNSTTRIALAATFAPMRTTTPTFSLSSNLVITDLYTANITQSASQITTNINNGNNGATLSFDNFSGLTAYRGYQLQGSQFILASAEL
jgi:hypothetical protein